MLRVATLGVLVIAGNGLSACGTMGGLNGMSAEERLEFYKGASEHISKCDRDYWANTGMPGSAGFRITCRQPQEAGAMAAAVLAAVKEVMASAAENPAPAASR